jgi:hypothetical protein
VGFTAAAPIHEIKKGDEDSILVKLDQTPDNRDPDKIHAETED